MMNRAFYYLLFLLLPALVCCTNEAERTRMRSGLDSLNVLNRSGQPFTPADVQPYVDFFDRHGTANDQLLAHYLMGRAYHEQGEAPMALQYYQQAAECADTTASDCDYAQLSRVYGQMATIYHEHRAIQMELTAQKTAEKIAWLAKDTLNALILHLNLTRSYYYLGNKDSALIISTETSQQFSDYGQQHLSAQALATAIDIWLERKETEKARQGLSVFENNSGVIAANVEALAGYEFFYSLKGRYYENINRNDSALYYYYKLLHAPNINNTEEAFKRLMNVYDKLMKPDSVRKYAVLFTQANDSASLAQSSEEVIRMQAIYNYSRHQKIAQEESEKAKRATEQFKAIASILLFVILIAYIVVAREKQKRRDAVRNYRESIAKIEQVQTELARLNTLTNSQEEVILQQKGQIRRQDGMISKLQDEIVSFQSKVKKTKENKRENSLKSTDEYKAFVQHAEKYTTPSNLEWTELRTKVFEFLPDFHQLLLSKRHELNISEYNVCILVRLQFKLSDIANLEGLSLSYINKIRKNLLKKLFEMEGKAEVFDEMIKEIY